MEIALIGLIVALIVVCAGWFFSVRRFGSSKDGLSADQLDKALKDNRQELSSGLKNATDSINKQFANLQTVLSTNLKDLRQDNHQQLDRMRQTVDEKLQSTLEKRLTESFKRVDRQLEAVNKNMGEMQNLATDVGDLQKTLTGVKTRGVWGEAHLGNLLLEILNPEQYVKNFRPRTESAEEVEFALKIPSQDGSVLYLPIDAKFPLTPFENLQKALETNETKAIDSARKSLHTEIKKQAKKIAEKYIHPPTTTDFAIMYLPLESLYAEVSQQTALIDELRRQYKTNIVGPNTVLPMIGMLSMGYRTLAIQKHAGEVWQILQEVQGEFGKFGVLLDKAQKKLTEASNVIESAGSKSRNIGSKLKKVQRLDMKETEPDLLEED